MKKTEQPLWENEGPDICRFCAYAQRKKNETVYCEKRRKELPEDESCRRFRYDILKKDLRRRALPQREKTVYNV